MGAANSFARTAQRLTTENTVEVEPSGVPRAYKRSPGLDNSSWYKSILVSQMAGTADNQGAFEMFIARIRPGAEPPPHVHSREHEVVYVLWGEMRFFVDGEVFQVTAGECMLLPPRNPHAFLITSEEAHMIVFTTPGGFLDAINKMNAPAERMEVPTDADAMTYANVDLTETIKLFEQYGVRFLTPDEIRAEMPEYPAGLISTASR
jgi:quercetin dioxygenase-like cupin family protein